MVTHSHKASSAKPFLAGYGGRESLSLLLDSSSVSVVLAQDYQGKLADGGEGMNLPLGTFEVLASGSPIRELERRASISLRFPFKVPFFYSKNNILRELLDPNQTRSFTQQLIVGDFYTN